MEINLAIEPMLIIAASVALWACASHIVGLGKGGRFAVIGFAVVLGVLAFATLISAAIS